MCHTSSTKMNRKVRFLFIVIVILCAIVQENDARRKIVRGRKVITRTYKKPLAIPAWAIIILVFMGEILVGALLYLVMKVTILDKPMRSRYVPAPLEETRAQTRLNRALTP